MKELIDFYGKFNEEKRLLNPYGQVEFRVTMHYISALIGDRKELSILESGAATGRYSLALAEMGHHVTAVDIVPYNIGILKQKAERMGISTCEAYVADARNLKKVPGDSQDLVLLLGPLYHLFSTEDKVAVLKEAKRIVKKDGFILAGYIMNDYAVISFGFKEGKLFETREKGTLSDDFKVKNRSEDLFSYDSLPDLEIYNREAGLSRVKILSQDGAANYMRKELNEMSEEMLSEFVRYQISVAERPDLLGAGCHTLDILRKNL